MESNKIENLLNAYFEGNTSLSEEKILKDYFNNHRVAEHLLQYKPIFVGLHVAGMEKSKQQLDTFEIKTSGIKPWWYSVAALLIIAFGVGAFYLSQPQLTAEEKEALVAFEKSKQAMMLLSENLNKGAGQLDLVDEFTVSKNKFLK
ncbi:hypothetical protein [Aequorivita echinoideorum]|uniref:Uncharacterized protein n=1 Tax=Aequorivita echinoideorum TaxID=1549647 RepID=A0ABS5S6S4_9FLAO|nr:hypothetical protein [Aequorivita echinoideorum]MBT0608130.1 hypothetical protein [Aequorivita echinoideorum]